MEVVTRLTQERAPEAIEVLCEAFSAYPAIQYIIGPVTKNYEHRLHSLTHFFVMARFLRNEPVLAVNDRQDTVMAVATVTLPGYRVAPQALSTLRENLWHDLGLESREHYERFGKACEKFAVERPHCHLNMIGVRPIHTGLGLARLLLDSVHELSQQDADSCGVTLNTEDRNNLGFYQHFGYDLLGHVMVSDELETWGFFRPNDQ